MALAAAPRTSLLDVFGLALTRLADLSVRDLLDVWDQMDFADIDSVIEAITAAASAPADLAGHIAADWYDDLREDHDLPPFTATPAPPLTAARVSETIERALGAAPSSPVIAVKVTPEMVRRVTSDVVHDSAVNTVIDATRADPAKPRYARFPDTAACSFCLMLALRGAVYASDASASFKPHLSCRCVARPVWTPDDNFADLGDLGRRWNEATRGAVDSADARRRWRRAVDGARGDNPNGSQVEPISPGGTDNVR